MQVLHQREHFCSVAPCTNRLLMPHREQTKECARVTEHDLSNRGADLIQGQSESERSVEASGALRSSALSYFRRSGPTFAKSSKFTQIVCTPFKPSHSFGMHFLHGTAQMLLLVWTPLVQGRCRRQFDRDLQTLVMLMCM